MIFRYINSMAVAWLLGSCLVVQLPELPALEGELIVLSSMVASLLMLLAGFIRVQKGALVKITAPLKAFILFCIAVGLSGGLAIWQGQQWLDQAVTSAWAGKTITVEGYIADLPAVSVLPAKTQQASANNASQDNHRYKNHTQRRSQFNFQVTNGQLAGRKLKLSWYSDEQLVAGSHWQLDIRVRPPRGFANPGGMDFAQWLLQQRIHGTGYVRAGTLLPSAESDLGFSLLQWRSDIRDRMQALLSDKSFSGILLALTIGERGGITTEQWQVVRATGVAHLLAISGLHIGGVFVLLYTICRWLWRLSPWLCRKLAAPRAAAVAGLLAAAGYAALAGFTLPTQRALIMLAIAAICLWLRRRPRLSTAYAVAVMAVLLLDPLAPLSAGFWLSFGVVGVLLWVGSHTLWHKHSAAVQSSLSAQTILQSYGENNALQRHLALGWARVKMIVQRGYWWRMPLVAAVISWPMSQFWFGRLALATPLANIVYVPLFSFLLVPLVLLALLCLPFSDGLAGWLLNIAHDLLAWCWQPLAWLAEHSLLWEQRLGLLGMPDPSISGLALALSVIGALWLLMPRGWPLRWLAPLLFLPLVFPVISMPKHGEIELTVLDVGQGLSAVVRTQNHLLVYDTGPSFRSGSAAAEHVVVPYLRAIGSQKIDTLLVSHADNDHAGGTATLLQDMSVQQLVSGEPEELALSLLALSLEGIAEDPPEGMAKTQVSSCIGQSWIWDGVQFEVLYPQADQLASNLQGNNASCVLKITANNFTALLTGDIERVAEQSLLADREHAGRLKADVVLIPHHGSRSSSTFAFTRAVQAKLAIAPAGFLNRWGFPKPDVVQRWQQSGAEVLVTGTVGAITVRDAETPLQWRQQRQRFWHQLR